MGKLKINQGPEYSSSSKPKLRYNIMAYQTIKMIPESNSDFQDIAKPTIYRRVFKISAIPKKEEYILNSNN